MHSSIRESLSKKFREFLSSQKFLSRKFLSRKFLKIKKFSAHLVFDNFRLILSAHTLNGLIFKAPTLRSETLATINFHRIYFRDESFKKFEFRGI